MYRAPLALDVCVNCGVKTENIYSDILWTTKFKKQLSIYVLSLKTQTLSHSGIKCNAENHTLLAGIRARLGISRPGLRDGEIAQWVKHLLFKYKDHS